MGISELNRVCCHLLFACNCFRRLGKGKSKRVQCCGTC